MFDLSVKSADYIAVHTVITNKGFDNEEVLRVVKSEKINEYDENTYAKIKGFGWK